MKVLFLSNNPYDYAAHSSLRAYNEAGFTVELVTSVMDAMEKAKVQKYALFVIERTAKDKNIDDDLFAVIQMVAKNNPNARVMSHGWKSDGLHYFATNPYSTLDHLAWFNYLRKIYQDLAFSQSNLDTK
jgi:hypothetical protein